MARDSFGHRWLRSLILTILNLVVVAALLGGGVYLALNRSPEIPDRSWLVLDLYGELPEYAPPGDFPGTLMAGDTVSLQDLLDALDKAAVDDRIAGVLWKLSAANDAGWAKLQELRDATGRVRDAGKPVLAWADNLDLRTLFLAAACDSIYQPPGGYCELRGMMRQTDHLRRMLDKLGIEPHVSKIREYKSAAELVTETGMTPPAREQAQRLLDGRWEAVIATVARERPIDRAGLLALMAQGAQMPAEAAAAGAIDRLSYWQELEAQLLGDRDEDRLPTVTAADLREVDWSDLRREGEETIAVIHAQGMIAGRESGVNPLLGIMMGHETVVRELRRARLDDEVAAIVLRVDSPGGEGLASDLIGHEVALCAAAKPTVVSMVDVAASGGYQIAFRATRLLADPLSIVGSIGSISAFFDLSDFYDRIGLDKDAVTVGPMAGLGRDDRAPTAAEWQAFQERHYADFNAWLQEVAEHRGLSFEQAEELAYGRVFSGEEAVANGLIDGLGNLAAAIREAAALAGLAPEASLRVVHLPEPPELLRSLLGGDDEVPVTATLDWALHRHLRGQLAETRRLLALQAALPPAAR